MLRSDAENFSGHEAAFLFHDGVRSGGLAVFRRVVRTLRLWSERSAERRVLAGMEAHRLRDIGKSRTDVLREARKWFWEA